MLAAGVPIPRPRRSVEGHAIATGVRVYEWLDLVPGERVDAATAGQLLARIHAVHWPAAGDVHWWYWKPVPTARWSELAAAAQAASAPFAAALAAAVPELVDAAALLELPDTQAVVTCHLDFNWENVLWRHDGDAVVIDWENAGASEPRLELAATLIEFGGAAETFRAYIEAGGEAFALEPRDFRLAIAVHSHLIELYSDRWLEADGRSEQRRRHAHWLSELLPPLATRRSVDAILAQLTRTPPG